MLQYLRTINSLENDLEYTILEEPYKPFIVELFLAIVKKLTNQNAMFLMFGVFTFISGYLTWLLYSELNLQKNIKILALCILVCSPYFFLYGLREVKVEPFLLTFSLISYLLYLRCFKYHNILNFFLFGVVLGITTLIKILLLPLSLLLLISFFIYLVLQKSSLKSYFGLAISVVSFFTTFFIWTVFFGLRVNWTSITIYPQNAMPLVKLSRNLTLLNSCIETAKTIDSNVYHFNNNFGDLVMQPFNLLVKNRPIDYSFSFIDPGILIYMSIWLFPLVFLTNIKDARLRLILVVVQIFTLIYFLEVRTIYWYLYALFPFYVLVIPFILDFVSNILSANSMSKKQRFLLSHLSKFFLILVLSVIFMYFSVFTMVPFIDTTDNLKSVVTEYNHQVNMLDQTAYILDTSIDVTHILLPQVLNYDKRVIKSNFYFTSSNLSFLEIKKELLSNNIKFILTYELPGHAAIPIYGCPYVESTLVKDFVNSYAVRVGGVEGYAGIYKINE